MLKRQKELARPQPVPCCPREQRRPRPSMRASLSYESQVVVALQERVRELELQQEEPSRRTHEMVATYQN